MQDMQDYLQATIMRQSSPEEAFRRYDELAMRHVEVLRRLTKQIQDARIARDNDAIKRAINEYDEALEAYIPGVQLYCSCTACSRHTACAGPAWSSGS